MTKHEAEALIRLLGDGHRLEETPAGGYLIKRPGPLQHQIVGYGNLLQAMIRAGLPVLVRNQAEAAEVTRAAFGPNATARVRGGECQIAREGVVRIDGRGPSWPAAFASVGVKALDEAMLGQLVRPSSTSADRREARPARM